MASLKQILVTLSVLLVGGGIWMALDERAGVYLLNSGLPIPADLRSIVVSPAPSSQSGGAVLPRVSGPSSRRGHGGGDGGYLRPSIVVAGEVGTAVTRNRMRAIGTGEAQRSVAVHPDVTGIVEAVAFASGDQVAIGDMLASLTTANEELAIDRARIALAAAEEKVVRLERLEASRAASSVEVTDAGRERENAALDLRAAQIALEKRRITAPIAGRVGIVSVDTGDLVTSQTLITTIDDRTRLKVIFFTPESFVRELRIGAPIEAVSTARPEKIHTGRISAIDSRVDEASRTLRTEATIDNPADELRPGMSFSLTLAFEGETLLAVDPLAVQWERSGPIVWKIMGDTVAKTPVLIVERTIDRVLVTSDGLNEGDRIVVEGLQSLRDGGKVAIQNAPASPRDGVQVPAAERTPGTAPSSGKDAGIARSGEGAPTAATPGRASDAGALVR